MAKDKLTDYSATNSLNTDVGGVNIDEGCLPSGINNAIREVMTHLKDFAEGTQAVNAIDVVGTVTADSAVFDGTGAVKMPVGTTAQRPTPAQGQIRYNTTDGSFEGYDGSAWGAIGGASEVSFILYEYTATSGQTTFSGADDNAATLSYTVNNIQVVMNGVILDPSDYTATNGTSVVLASGAALNDIVNIYAFQSFTVADTVSASAGGTFSANVAINGDLTVDTNTLYVDSTNNRVGIGTASPNASLEVFGAGATTMRLHRDNASGGGGIDFYNNTQQVANINAGSGTLTFSADPTSGAAGSYVSFETDGSERMRIDSSGEAYFLNTLRVVAAVGDNPAYTNAASDEGVELNTDHIVAVRDSAVLLYLNRIGSDGTLVQFYAQGNSEGTISVSGTTVSYNGGHLARWSQLADNTRDESILKGTVMTNLDQMAEWTNEGVTEDNEQLNCMAVSNVEGDPNVAGVFVNWDNDDDIYTNDMNIAMTGDMVIRIAQGTTVQRGDLLMSAGDGTAKPQGDDIVRSKTIAKVTSTHVSHTYDDGSYLVPCVLMAC